ncbi:hypothetical protein CU048_05655 [Beijerinckiaceae bacterium]|nr:hypothetical protein CU048_05655 [Beijerinckiaceae bacterium]
METRARYVLIGLFVLVTGIAGFGFVYWLHATGGLGERSVFRVRFDGPVSGLRAGAPVLFNGIHVGEVTALQLSSANPGQVFVTIAVDRNTPVRADSKVRIDVQGLMGSPSIALIGGSAALPVLAASQGEPPMLIADASAGQDLTQSARQVLGLIDKVVSENSDTLHDAITNLDTFSAALSRNSNRIDGIVAGLEKTFGGSEPKGPLPTFDLAAPRVIVTPPKKPSKQLVVADLTTLVRNDTQRITIVAKDGQSSFLENAQWADSVPKLLQAKIIQSLENADFLSGVGRASDGLSNDYQLLIDLRSFQISLSSPPKAEIEFAAKIVAQSGRIIDSRVFRAEALIKAVEPAAAVEALDQAFMQAASELVEWTAKKI